MMATQTSEVPTNVGLKRKLDDRVDVADDVRKRLFESQDLIGNIERNDRSRPTGIIEVLSRDHKDTEMERLNILLSQSYAKTIALANLIGVPVTHGEQLPALIESITKYLAANIVTYDSNGQAQEPSGMEFGYLGEIENQRNKGGHEALTPIEPESSEDDVQLIESDGQRSAKGSDDEYEEDSSVVEDSEDEDRDLPFTPKAARLSGEDKLASSPVGANPLTSEVKGRGGTYSSRRAAKRQIQRPVETPWRRPVYKLKQVLLSPQPDP